MIGTQILWSSGGRRVTDRIFGSRNFQSTTARNPELRVFLSPLSTGLGMDTDVRVLKSTDGGPRADLLQRPSVTFTLDEGPSSFFVSPRSFRPYVNTCCKRDPVRL